MKPGWNTDFRQNFFAKEWIRVISSRVDNVITINHSRSVWFRFGPWLVLLLILLFTGFIRFRLLDMPLERDEGEYAYAGQLIMQGVPPYELAYNMKLPGTYYACALGMEIFGDTIAGLHATLLVVNSLTVFFVFLLGRKLFGVVAGLVAAASYAVMSVTPQVLGMATHANQFVVLFAVPATLLLWEGLMPVRRRFLFYSGLLYGLAFVMKQQGVVFGAFGGLYLAYLGLKTRDLAGAFKNALCYGLGMCLPFGCLCLVLAAEGVFGRFWFWTFTYAHSYVAIMSWHDGLQWLSIHLAASVPSTAGLWFLAVLGLLLGLSSDRLRSPAIFTGGFWVCSFLGTAIGLYFRGHYFILVLPAFSLLVGAAVAGLQEQGFRRISAGLNRAIPVAVFGLALGCNIYVLRPYFFFLPEDLINRILYVHCPFIESLVVADYIRTHASPDARIAVLGSEPEIYFYARRHSATGFIYTYPLMELQPHAKVMQQQMIGEIEAAHPEYLVWVGFPGSWLIHPGSELGILDWYPQYTAMNYDLVGLVNSRPDGSFTSLWDEKAKNYHGPVEETYIAVYKSRDYQVK